MKTIKEHYVVFKSVSMSDCNFTEQVTQAMEVCFMAGAETALFMVCEQPSTDTVEKLQQELKSLKEERLQLLLAQKQSRLQ